MLPKDNHWGRFIYHPLYEYDKTKTNILKCILPLGIILQHMCNYGYPQLSAFGGIDAIIMWLFFAMSGYGLVISYINNEKYIEKFPVRSMIKLFVPYLTALCLFVAYYGYNGVDQIELLKEKGLGSFVPTSWFIWTLAIFYILFYFIFSRFKTNVAIKVVSLCIVVLAYSLIAPYIGIETWRYERCPGFCIGALYAYCNKQVLTHMKRWHIILMMAGCLVIMRFVPFLFYPALVTIVFMILNLIKVPTIIGESKIVTFVSAISFELFILQFLPIYIVANDIGIKSTTMAVCAVISIDVVLAYFMHLINTTVATTLRRKLMTIAS